MSPFVTDTHGMSHGFRLFEVTVHDGMRRTPLPFAKGGVGGWNLIDTISELWQLHQGRTLHGLPKLTLSDVDAAGADEATVADGGSPSPNPKPVFRVEQ